MAREIQTILDDLMTQKAADANLAVLTNPSNVSVWYNLLGVFAVETNIMETLADLLLDDINSRALEIPTGTILWYATETLNYQYGDSLEVIDGIPQYSVIDEAKRVVKQSACTEQSGTLLIKAGKLDGTGATIPLAAAELSGLQQYWIEKRFAGVNLSVISVNPDIVKAYINIEIDGQVLSLTGESLAASGTYPVEDAIKEYYQNVDFGGTFRVMELVDAIQSVDGIINVVPSSILVKTDAGTTWAEVLDVSTQEYNAYAGYLIEDPANLLRNTLNYYI